MAKHQFHLWIQHNTRLKRIYDKSIQGLLEVERFISGKSVRKICTWLLSQTLIETWCHQEEHHGIVFWELGYMIELCDFLYRRKVLACELP